MEGYKFFKKREDGKLISDNVEYNVGQKIKFDGELSYEEKNGFMFNRKLYECFYEAPNNGDFVYYKVVASGDILGGVDFDEELITSEIEVVSEVNIANFPEFDKLVEKLSKTLVVIKKRGLFNVMNVKDGWLSLKVWADNIYKDLNGKIMVNIDQKYNILKEDCSGFCLDRWYDLIHSHFTTNIDTNTTEGYYIVTNEGEKNFLSEDFRFISDMWFDDVRAFHNDFAPVKKNGKVNYIDMNGKLLMNIWVDKGYFFTENYAEIQVDGENLYVDRDGNITNEEPK